MGDTQKMQKIEGEQFVSFSDCKACNGTGQNTRGTQCRICQVKAQELAESSVALAEANKTILTLREQLETADKNLAIVTREKHDVVERSRRSDAIYAELRAAEMQASARVRDLERELANARAPRKDLRVIEAQLNVGSPACTMEDLRSWLMTMDGKPLAFKPGTGGNFSTLEAFSQEMHEGAFNQACEEITKLKGERVAEHSKLLEKIEKLKAEASDYAKRWTAADNDNRRHGEESMKLIDQLAVLEGDRSGILNLVQQASDKLRDSALSGIAQGAEVYELLKQALLPMQPSEPYADSEHGPLWHDGKVWVKFHDLKGTGRTQSKTPNVAQAPKSSSTTINYDASEAQGLTEEGKKALEEALEGKKLLIGSRPIPVPRVGGVTVGMRIVDETVLEEAARLVDGERQKSYGSPRENWGLIAQLWQAYLNRKIDTESNGLSLDAHDAAMLMVLMKVARDVTGERKRDNLVDIAGYVRVAERCATDPA